MKTLKINHLAILVCFVLLTVLGFVWYGPLFGEKWMGMVGLDLATVEANPPGAGIWITNVVATLIPLYTLAWLFTKLSVDSAGRGAAIGLLIVFAFEFMSTMTGNMFAQNPYGLTWITGGYNLVAIGLSGAILGGWRKYSEG